MNKDKEDKGIEELIDEEEIEPLSGNKVERDAKGRFLPGHEIGRLPKSKVYSTDELVQAIKEVEEEDKVDVLKHYVRQSLIDNRVMIDLIGKKIPKITINEIKGTGLPFNLFVTQFIEEKKKEKEINEKPKLETMENKGENACPPPCG